MADFKVSDLRRRVNSAMQNVPALFMGERNFFSVQTIQQLAVAQNVRPIIDISVLSGGFSKDEDADEFVEEIYRARN